MFHRLLFSLALFLVATFLACQSSLDTKPFVWEVPDSDIVVRMDVPVELSWDDASETDFENATGKFLSTPDEPGPPFVAILLDWPLDDELMQNRLANEIETFRSYPDSYQDVKEWRGEIDDGSEALFWSVLDTDDNMVELIAHIHWDDEYSWKITCYLDADSPEQYRGCEELIDSVHTTKSQSDRVR